MRKYKLYLREPCSGHLGPGGAYRYEDGVLELLWYGESSYHPVRPGNGVLLKLDERGWDVRGLTPPKTREDRLLWLAGVPKVARCASREAYDAMVDRHDGGPVRHVGGRDWQVAESLTPEGRIWIVAGWVAPRIGGRAAREMLRRMGSAAPAWYTDRIMRRR